MDMQIKYDKREVKKFMNFVNKFPRRFNDFMTTVTHSVAEQSYADILSIVTDKEFESYIEALEVIRVKGETAHALILDEIKVSSDILDEQIDIVYFIQTTDDSSLGKFLVDNSPFVIGFVRKIPEGMRVITRRISTGERAKILEKNLEIRNDLNDIRNKYTAVLQKIEDVHIDVYFMIMRLEFGLPGYPNKPHWRKIKYKMDGYISKALKENDLFSNKSFKRMKTVREIEPDEIQKLNGFEENFL